MCWLWTPLQRGALSLDCLLALNYAFVYNVCLIAGVCHVYLIAGVCHDWLAAWVPCSPKALCQSSSCHPVSKHQWRQQHRPAGSTCSLGVRPKGRWVAIHAAHTYAVHTLPLTHLQCTVAGQLSARCGGLRWAENQLISSVPCQESHPI